MQSHVLFSAAKSRPLCEDVTVRQSDCDSHTYKRLYVVLLGRNLSPAMVNACLGLCPSIIYLTTASSGAKVEVVVETAEETANFFLARVPRPCILLYSFVPDL